MNYILLDSSFSDLSVGLKKGRKLIDQISYPCFQRQSEFMVYEINNLLKRNHLTMKDINGIVTSIGPGSYTGIRISLTIAKVASLTLKIPIYPLSSLEINKVMDKDSIVLFNARANRSYIASFSKNKRLLKDQVMYNEEVNKYIKSHSRFAISGDASYLNIKSTKVNVLENMSILMNEVKPIKNPHLIKPIYLKESYK